MTKGELVKVTNTAMDKKWCIAVTTTGMSGSVKKKHLENVEPGMGMLRGLPVISM